MATTACEWLDVRDLETDQVERVEARGLFLMLGAEPHCEWLPSEVLLDERGFVVTGRDVPKHAWGNGLPPTNLSTTLPGVFAAGDVRAGSMKRVASASGEGASVVPLVHAWLAPSDDGLRRRQASRRRRSSAVVTGRSHTMPRQTYAAG